MLYKAIIFDLDGTLLDTIGDLSAAADATLRALGYPTHTVEEYKRMVGNGVPKLIERFLPPQHRDEETRRRAAGIFFPYYDAHKEDTTAPYPGIPELLAALQGRGVKLGVVSNKEHTLTQSVIAHYFPDTFDAVAGHTLGTPAKPDPRLVNGMRAAFGLAPGEVLYAGDSDVDIETAHNAQLAACGVLWGFRTEAELRAAGAEFLVHTPEEIGNL
ncbi:MAG: HAD family hydrolase [Subdoligranulum sp.]|nr:HAD family hydrolase [Subdoligranulum sp.]